MTHKNGYFQVSHSKENLTTKHENIICSHAHCTSNRGRNYFNKTLIYWQNIRTRWTNSWRRMGKSSSGCFDELSTISLWNWQKDSMKAIFADTGYWIALFNPWDYLYSKAIAVSQVTQNRLLVTSQMVLTEFLNHYSVLGQFFRQRAVVVVRNL